MTNDFPGRCDDCNKLVAAGDGEIRRDLDGSWILECDGCAIKRRNRERLKRGPTG